MVIVGAWSERVGGGENIQGFRVDLMLPAEVGWILFAGSPETRACKIHIVMSIYNLLAQG